MDKRIYKSGTNRVLFGVCGGIGEYLNVDPTFVRIALVILIFAGFGTGALAYIICALIIPEPPKDYDPFVYDQKKNSKVEVLDEYGNTVKHQYSHNEGFRKAVGFFLIFIGGLYFLDRLGREFFPFLRINLFGFSWGILLIIIGIVFLRSGPNKDK